MADASPQIEPPPPGAPSADTSGELAPLPKGLASFGPTTTLAGRRSLIVLTLAAMILTLYVLWPFRTALFMAVVMAAALFPLHVKLEAKLKGRSALSAALMTTGLLLALALPVASVITFVAQEVVRGVAWAREVLGINSVTEFSMSKLPPNAQQFIDKTLATFHVSPEQLRLWAASGLDWAQAMSKQVLGASAGFAGGLILMLIAFYVLLLDGQQALRFVKSVSPLPRAQTKELFLEFRNVTTAAVLGSAVTALVQGTLATLGYLVSGVPHPFFLGVTTMLGSFIPAVGTMLVWVPACGVLVMGDHVTSAIGLAIFSLVIVGGADNVVKPLMMKGKVAMHGGLLLLSLLGGVVTFGLMGIILGPLILSFLVALLRIYKRDYQEAAS